MERDLPTYPIWERYSVLSHVISNLTVRERRQIFQLARNSGNFESGTFFPKFGFTLEEFAIWYTLGETRRKARRHA